MARIACLLAALLLIAPTAQAASGVADAVQSAEEVRVFAAGGTQVSNGLFFPGTALSNGGSYIGEPLVVPKGADLRFTNLDVSAFSGAHKITSFKRVRRGGKSIPLFSSKAVEGPGDDLVITSHLKRGTYDYFCSIHSGMFGLIEVR